eukprot:CAMPEP_0168320592 /NCGR_PEP_ID=MMETSP0213-20121227/1769_1 /TAXON_ID=151035 /ORGANISM="Euplotes harpa, Strain FSP1.4" /LENGTH=152 /DNA_ID=CAMNT_0008322085 /DNA_START=137 /DNA_END=595 /DNA_ORIENTATION=-
MNSLYTSVGVLFTANDIRVLAGVIQLLDVVKLDHAVLVHVQLVVSLSDQVLSERIQIALHEPQELIKVDGAVAITVHGGHDLVRLVFRDRDSEVNQSPSEVVEVQLVVAVVVHRFEDPGKTSDSKRAAFKKPVLDVLKQVLDRVLLVTLQRD